MIRSLSTSIYRTHPVRGMWQPIVVSTRTFIIPTVVLRADLVQDLYVKELRSYRPTPTKPSDSDGHVQKFSPPQAPQTPGTEDIASELRQYESQQVEVEDQTATEDSTAPDEDWFEQDEGDKVNTSH